MKIETPLNTFTQGKRRRNLSKLSKSIIYFFWNFNLLLIKLLHDFFVKIKEYAKTTECKFNLNLTKQSITYKLIYLQSNL